jgi:hypothetical protein
MCGKAAERTALGSLLCAVCRMRCQEFNCQRCGQRVMYLDEIATEHLEFAAGTCGTCRIWERADALGAADRSAILAAARQGVVRGVKEARDRLGWSIGEAASLVQVLLDET